MSEHNSDRALDGNAAAGPFEQVFGVDLTTAVVTCAGCGAAGAFAEQRAFLGSPGTVLRCPGCDHLLARVVALLEALIGAVFLDGGYPVAAALVERLWGERLRARARPPRDAKTALQEWAQGRGLPTPSYREIARSGPHHDPEFRISVELPNLEPAEGVGRSKRAAEQAAAAVLLAREGVEFAVTTPAGAASTDG